VLISGDEVRLINSLSTLWPAKQTYVFQGYASPFNNIAEVVLSFQRLSSGGDRNSCMFFLRENAEGAGMPPLLSH